MPVKIDTDSTLFEYRVRPCRSLPDWCIENGKFYWPIEKVFSVTCMYKQPYLYARAKSDKRVSRYGHLRMLVRFHVNVLRILLGNHN